MKRKKPLLNYFAFHAYNPIQIICYLTFTADGEIDGKLSGIVSVPVWCPRTWFWQREDTNVINWPSTTHKPTQVDDSHKHHTARVSTHSCKRACDSHLAQLILKSRRQPTDFPRGFLAGRALDSSSRAGAADPPDPHARVLRTVWTSTFLPNPALWTFVLCISWWSPLCDDSLRHAFAEAFTRVRSTAGITSPTIQCHPQVSSVWDSMLGEIWRQVEACTNKYH